MTKAELLKAIDEYPDDYNIGFYCNPDSDQSYHLVQSTEIA